MRFHCLRLSVLGSTLLMLLMLTANTVSAATHPPAGVNRANFGAIPHHSTPVHLKVSALDTSSSGTHYLYVDDGTSPDSIDVYKTGKTLTHVGNYPTDGNNTIGGPYGASNIAVTPGCLLFGTGDGYLDSFVLNADGSLGTEASHLQTYGASPDDIHIKGAIAYVNIPDFNLLSYSIGTGCVLTPLHSLITYSEYYLQFAIIGNDWVTIDTNTGNIDTFALGADGSITPKKFVRSQISIPDGVAIQTVNGTTYRIFTGQGTAGAPQVQGGKFEIQTGSVHYLKSSPATDPNGTNGASVIVDNADAVLIQGEQYSDTLANYSIKGGLVFLSETPMAVSGESPSTFVQLNNGIFIDMIYNGDIEHCQLTSSGATGCKTVVTLTDNSGVSAGMALL